MEAEALAAIAGALAGAFIAGALALYRDWRRELGDARVAREVFLSEMDEACGLVAEGIQRETWPLGWKRWSETWDAFRGPLARHVDSAVFASVAQAYARMYELEHGLQGGTREFVDQDLEFFERVQAEVKSAHGALTRARVTSSFIRRS
jgi:hypothetical protein